MLIQLVQNLEIAKMSLRTETPLIQVIDKPVLPLPISLPGRFVSFLKGFLINTFFLSFYLVVKRILQD
jgi:hypothetical protein